MAVNALLLLTRCAMALVWLYNGLWLKIALRDPHHHAIVTAIFGSGRADAALTIIGGGETLLALGIVSGVAPRFVNGFQIALLLGMNVIGILSGGGQIANPVGLLIQNLPLLCCATLILVQGPGTHVVRLPRRGR